MIYRYDEVPGRLKPREGERLGLFRALELERAVLAVLDPEGRLGSGAMSPSAAQDFVRSLVDRTSRPT